MKALLAIAASLVLHNGTVWTGEGTTASAVRVEGERITAVGDDAVVLSRSAPGDRLVDLRGAFVAPGFTDNHVHVLEQGNLGSLEPSWTGYNPATAEALRAVILGYHAATFAAGQTPEDGCSATPVSEGMKAGLLETQAVLARQGITTVVEAGLSDLGLLEALSQLDAEGKLRMRFLVRVGWGCVDEALAAGWPDRSSQWVRVSGVKLYSDGWLGPRTAALRENYADRPYDGFLFLEQQRADADVARARGMGLNVTTHAIGDRGLETMLTAYERAGVGPEARAQLEHAQVLAPDLIDRMAAAGAIASVQLSFATTDMRFAESALGPERAGRSYAWRTLIDRGVRLAGGSDYPVEVINPLWGLQRVVTRTEFDGTPPGGWHPDQRLTVEQALRLITVDGAYARLEENERGTIAPGRYADLVVLREDPTRLPPDCIAAATVLMTVVNGQVAFEGAQAYPPGDASCPSGRAPAAGPSLTASAPDSAAEPCRPAAALARVRPAVRGRRLRIRLPRRAGAVSVEAARVASLSTPLAARRAKRLGRRRRAVSWRLDRLRSGWYVLRLRGNVTREIVVRRDEDGVTVRPPYSLAGACGAVGAFRLSGPVFGGRRDRPLDVAYRLRRAGPVRVELLRGGRVIARLAEGTRRSDRTYRLRVAARGREPGDYAVRLTAGGRSIELTAARL